MYACSCCSYKTSSVKSYVSHYRIHSHLHNVGVPCCIKTCSRKFSSYSSLNTHLTREHQLARPKNRQDGRVAQLNADLTCSIETCESTFSTTADLVKHLQLHIEHGVEVCCPFTNCPKKFRVASSLRSHITRNHRFHTVINHVCDDSPANVEDEQEQVDDEEIAVQDTPDYAKLFEENLALFYLKLQSKHHVPSSTLQAIVVGVRDATDIGYDLMKEKLTQNLLQHLPQETVQEIVNDTFHDNPFQKVHSSEGSLRSEFKRNQLYKERFRYVEPTSIELGHDVNNKVRYCHYIPILQTLKFLFQDQSFLQQYNKPKQSSNEGVFEDYIDGSICKSNVLFEGELPYIKLILFQDAFEVVNPLGSAKKKHKLLGVYMTLQNIYPEFRSKIDSIQLVLLCREVDVKYFTQQRVFECIVRDVKTLETVGIDVGLQSNVHGTIVCLVGDNLGNHFIGGFVESFSATYVCRYCNRKKDNLYVSPFAIKKTELRTPKHYDDAVRYLHEHPETDSYEGVKFSSLFNELKFFHVCKPGLPPCLGHDLFEGVVQYDVALFIRYMVEIEKWFTYETLNRRIKGLTLLGSDAKDKPNEIGTRSVKLGGHAIQNWCFVRFLPLIIGSEIKDPSNPVWQLFLLLRNIVQFVCAQKITQNQVAYMGALIEEYIELRRNLFPGSNLRPKHHFLVHYPHLTLQYGPLIRLWTMRFESKHQYFNQCVRSAQNFKNITKTLSERHQLLQAYLGVGKLFPDYVESRTDSVPFDAHLYSPGIQSAVQDFISSEILYCSKAVTVYGTEYKQGMLVITKNCGHLQLGKIVLCLSGSKILFILKLFIAEYLSDFGIHNISELSSGDNYMCLPYEKLLDFQPLSAYTFKGLDVVVTKTSVVDES